VKTPPATLEQLTRLCQNAGANRELRPPLPSGFAELDANLPGGGWPCGAIAELISDAVGIGELGLLMPTLSHLARAGRYIAWIAPPYLPYAPALAQRGLPLERMLLIRAQTLQQSLWATEQALRCPAIGAVLSWPAYIVDKNVRRLQLAAEAAGTVGFIYRPPEAARESSPAALRLRLHAASDGIIVEIHKSRGGRAGARLQCRNHRDLAVHTPAAARA
jgi:protein ImuA